jgi:transcriptional regulator with XRE-family HTH domain
LTPATPISDYKYAMRINVDFTWSEVGTRIRHRRTARGLSQQALADAACLTQNAIYRLEAGESNPQITTLQQVANGLGCSVRELMCGVPETATRLSGRLNRVRAIIESGDEDAIRTLDHGIETAEMLLVRSDRRRSVPPPPRKLILKGEGQRGPNLASLWNEARPHARSEADAPNLVTSTALPSSHKRQKGFQARRDSR